MTRKEKLATAVSVTAAVAMLLVVMLTLFKSEEYAKYLPLVVWLSAMAGFALYFVEEEDQA